MRLSAIFGAVMLGSGGVAILVLALFAAAIQESRVAIAADWPQFRGPDGNGVVTGASLPTQWSETENIVWKTEIPGRGWSSPVIGNGLIWVTTATEEKLTEAEAEKIRAAKLAGNFLKDQMDIVGKIVLKAIAVDATTGKQVQDVTLFEVVNPDPVHQLNSFSSPTPVLTNEGLYCHFGTYGTAAVDLSSGKIRWTTQLKIEHSVGPGSSPVVYENLLIVPCDGVDVQYVTALDLRTGKEVWKTDRPEMSGSLGEMHKSFCTPIVVSQEGADQVVVVGAQWVVAYEPMTGKEVWRLRHGEGFSVTPRPVVGNGLVYFSTGYMLPHMLAVKLGGRGDVSKSHLAWAVKKQVPTMPSPVLVGKDLYFVSDLGVANCVDGVSGKVLWSERIEGNYSASPIVADGRIYFSSREGLVTVVEAGPKYQEVATNKLDGQLMASPAVVDNSLVLRTQSHLYRIGQ